MRNDESFVYVDFEILDDHDIAKLSDEDFRTWLYIRMLLKMRGGTTVYDPEEIAWRIRRTKEQVVSAIDSACSLGLMNIDEDNMLQAGDLDVFAW